MRWLPRIFLTLVAGFLIAKAHTSLPLLAPICLAPLLVALLAPAPGDPDGSGPSPLPPFR